MLLRLTIVLSVVVAVAIRVDTAAWNGWMRVTYVIIDVGVGVSVGVRVIKSGLAIAARCFNYQNRLRHPRRIRRAASDRYREGCGRA